MAPRILLLSLLFLTVSPLAMPAQVTIIDGDQPWIRCDTCWRGYDSVLPHFTIGAVDFKYPDSAAAWGLDFTTLNQKWTNDHNGCRRADLSHRMSRPDRTIPPPGNLHDGHA